MTTEVYRYLQLPFIIAHDNNLDPHWRHEPILVAHKTLTESSTYVKFVITFEGAANPTHNLSLWGLHNHNWYG